MNRYFSSASKAKASLLLVGIMVVIVVVALSMKQAMRDVDQALTSVYMNRLQPAVTIVYLSEHIHAKRLAMEAFLLNPRSMTSPPIYHQLTQFDRRIGQLISEFEKTDLVKGEARRLQQFKARMHDYSQLEQMMLQLQTSGQVETAVQLFNGRGSVIFQQSVHYLHELAHIQAETGQALVGSSHQQTAGVSLHSTLLISLAILIGLLIQGLIYKTRLVSTNPQPFHLN
ncbi:MCP four helix bundle domain-containing protein [Spirosoma sp. BT702]|uniref:MCP four helix bundle domain-containing protein n=1 Tax=Spirosoma profusum TaxID=2771354 RepID=A0A926Y0Q1_9BACT|nr:MCP four helix bundle domain-containing protein [Spirosoma profusum]MBD2704453.1 MCP four helix bundle domain-containing protein [Spirosoma profusum]